MKDHQSGRTLELIERRAQRLADRLHDTSGTDRGADRALARMLVIEQAMRCWLLTSGPGRTLSPAAQRNLLKRLINKGNYSVAIRDQVDNATWARIATFHEGNRLAFWNDPDLNPAEIEAAVLAAYADLGPNKRGRPGQTASLARLQLAQGLAFVWWQLTGNSPSRQISDDTPSGEFFQFTTAVVAAVPYELWRYQNGGRPGVDNLARCSVLAFSLAKRAGDLNVLSSISEQLFLGPLPSRDSYSLVYRVYRDFRRRSRQR